MSSTSSNELIKTSPVVVDARVDSAKLQELLDLASEYPELDFKQTLDLGSNSTKDNLSFVKDALSMSNSTHGGYLVIGATEDGKPAHDCSPIDPAHFDTAILKDKVSAYVADHVSIASKIHLVEGRSIALIYVGPPSDKIPHVTTKEGKLGNGTIVQKGVIYTRQSAQNIIANSNDLRRLLDPYRSVAFDEGRSHVDELIRTLTQTFAGANGGVPMIIDSDIASFAEALRSNLDYGNVKQIEGFIRTARRRISYHPGDDARRDRQLILDKLALLAIETCEEPDNPLFTGVLKALATSYNSTGFMSDSTRITNAPQVQMACHFIDVLVRVYLIGAAAVRENNLHAVQAVSMVPVQNGTDAFSNYSSWIRHGITYASRANLLSSESDSQTLLAMARQLGHDVPELVTGLSNDLTERESDSLLSDMTSFDIMWCMAAAATTTAGNETYEMYTSFASVNPRRGEMILIRLATDAESRQTLAPPATDADFARSLDHVLNLARTESYRYNTFWSRAQDIPEVANFIKTHKESA